MQESIIVSSLVPLCLQQAYKFDILKKLKNKKTHNSRKKLNNSAEKLKDLTKFTERRKKLKYFCCKNTFYQKSIAFSYKKTMLPSINSIFLLRNSIKFFKISSFVTKLKEKTQGFDKSRNASCRKQVEFVSLV